jgi:four helix bundle protein
MSASGTHRNLAVWKRAIALAGKVYAATRALPSDEQFQLRGAALAVPIHIAAGCARNRVELVQCLQLARAALYETETRVMVAVDQGALVSDETLLADIAELTRQLDAFIQSVGTSRLAAHAKSCGREPPSSC